jgi:hypothetical protein
MSLPKLKIVKKFVLNDLGHYRYYSPYYNPDTKTKVLAPSIDLNKSFFETEKQLCQYILSVYGPGEYRLIAWKIGRKGCWTFWKGEITADGFIFFIKTTNTSKVIKKLKKQLLTADDDKKATINEEIDFEKELKPFQEAKNYGFVPYLKPSGKRGTFIRWEDEYLIPKEEFDYWQEEKNKEENTKNAADDWGIDKKTRKEVKQSFEQWQ